MGERPGNLGAGNAVEGVGFNQVTFGGVGIEGPDRRGLPCYRTAGVAPGVEKRQIPAAVTSFDARDGVKTAAVAIVEELMQIASIGIHCVWGETPLIDESPQIGPDR
jgi:hypothetical protein